MVNEIKTNDMYSQLSGVEKGVSGAGVINPDWAPAKTDIYLSEGKLRVLKANGPENPYFRRSDNIVTTISTKEELERILNESDDKYVVIFFGMDGCKPCEVEEPHFRAQAKELAGKDVRFVYTKKSGMAYNDHFITVKDGEENKINMVKIPGLPTVVIFHKGDGQIAYNKMNLAEEIRLFGAPLDDRIRFYEDKLENGQETLVAEAITGLGLLVDSGVISSQDKISYYIGKCRELMINSDDPIVRHYLEEHYPIMAAKMDDNAYDTEALNVANIFESGDAVKTARALNVYKNLLNMKGHKSIAQVAKGLEKLLKHSDANVRASAAYVYTLLERYIKGNDTSILADGIYNLFTLVEDPSQPDEVMASAAKGLRAAKDLPNDDERVQKGIGALVHLIYHPNPAVRAAAIDSAARLGAKLSISQVKSLFDVSRKELDDPDMSVRIMSLRAIRFLYQGGRIGVQDIISCWSKMLTDTDGYEAITTLSTFIKDLIPLLSKDDLDFLAKKLQEAKEEGNKWFSPKAAEMLDLIKR